MSLALCSQVAVRRAVIARRTVRRTVAWRTVIVWRLAWRTVIVWRLAWRTVRRTVAWRTVRRTVACRTVIVWRRLPVSHRLTPYRHRTDQVLAGTDTAAQQYGIHTARRRM